ncbi:hypothetical protein EVAR_103365_1 [Eumeta japonica]|uniref:Uncharacterized protein n=1 Tax=Eumeta variegata TaxID=151549 RepID=A0A4C1Y7M8_EUMVA|nr:hypothetical protein EVAR_103365_1 [Eumeta japonica]
MLFLFWGDSIYLLICNGISDGGRSGLIEKGVADGGGHHDVGNCRQVNGPARPVQHHALTAYTREVTGSAVEIRSLTKAGHEAVVLKLRARLSPAPPATSIRRGAISSALTPSQTGIINALRKNRRRRRAARRLEPDFTILPQHGQKPNASNRQPIHHFQLNKKRPTHSTGPRRCVRTFNLVEYVFSANGTSYYEVSLECFVELISLYSECGRASGGAISPAATARALQSLGSFLRR